MLKLSMILTRRMQRLGDLAAGTMVIVDERAGTCPLPRLMIRVFLLLALFSR